VYLSFEVTNFTAIVIGARRRTARLEARAFFVRECQKRRGSWTTKRSGFCGDEVYGLKGREAREAG
jgi:hypothetical protein